MMAIVAMMAIKDKAVLTCMKEIGVAMVAIVVIVALAENAAIKSIGAMNANAYAPG